MRDNNTVTEKVRTVMFCGISAVISTLIFSVVQFLLDFPTILGVQRILLYFVVPSTLAITMFLGSFFTLNDWQEGKINNTQLMIIGVIIGFLIIELGIIGKM